MESAKATHGFAVPLSLGVSRDTESKLLLGFCVRLELPLGAVLSRTKRYSFVFDGFFNSINHRLAVVLHSTVPIVFL